MRRCAVPLMALVLVACAGPAEPGTSGPGTFDLAGSAWQLELGILDAGNIPMVDGYPISLSFTETDAGGIAACNRYGGPYTISGQELTFAPPAVTEMACSPQQVMESEAGYLEALVRVSNHALSDDTLTLTGEGVELIFIAIPPITAADLTETVWILDSLMQGDAVSSVMGDPASLELFTDGSMLGSTGCRTFNGTYEWTGTEVVVTQFAATGACPPELEEQDQLVVAVLGDGFRPGIAGNTLTVVTGDGEGLIYKSDD